MSDGSFTTADIAAHFNVKQGTVRNWINDGCPCERLGKGRPVKFDIAKVTQWRSSSSSSGARLDPQKEKALLDRERRWKVATERKLLEGKLVRADQVEELWGMIVSNLRAKLLALPNKVAPAALSCSSLMEVEVETRRLVYEALQELAVSGVPDIDALQPPPESDGEPVGGQVQETVSGGECGAGAVEDGQGTLPEGDT